jgi:hypothetical protein
MGLEDHYNIQQFKIDGHDGNGTINAIEYE